MAYIISGPTQIGTTGLLNNILGDLKFTDIGTTWGTVYFADTSGLIKALPAGVAGQVLQTNGNAADPTWVNNTATLTTNGFSVAKTAGDTFTNTEITVANWNTTAPAAGLGVNPFFNTGPDFNATTGVFTAPTTAAYIVNAYIEYSNTSPAHGSLKTLKFVETSSTPANGVLISVGPKQGSGNTASNEVLVINQVIKLNATSTYALRIVASTADATNTILSSSRFDVVLQSS